MNRFKMKIAKAVMGIMTSAIVFLCMTMVSLAGDVNSEEQRIIAFYEQVFSYNGKQYVATESAKAAAYSMLIDDRCDLTAAQVDSYIAQAWGNIEYGIKSGYLVPYEEDTTDTAENTEDTQNTENTDNTEDTSFIINPINDKTEEAERTEDDTTGQTTESDDRNNNDENNDSKPGNTDKVDVDELIEDLKNNGGAAYDSEGNEVSADGIKDALDKGETLTIEQHGEGTVTIIKKDGDILIQTGIPIKNTGYKTQKLIVMLAVLIAGGVILGILIRVFRRKSYQLFVMIAGILAVVSLAFVAGGNSLLDAFHDRWRSVWIGGAPQYEYTNSEEYYQADKEPIIGALYGEISCDRIGLRVPLYYGDNDDIFADGAGTYKGGEIPGKKGTVLIGAHDTTYFAPLEDIEQGDVINIKTTYGNFDYKVNRTAVAEASDKSAYSLSEDGEELILYTCYPFGETGKVRPDRFFVYGECVYKDGK